MTASSTLEARLRHRDPSSAPARATAKALGIAAFDNDIARARFNDLSHWGYGTGWGIVRGLLAAAGLPPAAATLTHGAAVWGSEQVAPPALDIAPPPPSSGHPGKSPSTPSTTPSTPWPPASPTNCSTTRLAHAPGSAGATR
jgi:hypothetical protein